MRVTPQRARVWRVLAESEAHLGAEEVWERAKDVLPGLELSTVYRVLDALREANLVVESRPPEGPTLFEARGTWHPHLICEVCGKISHPDPEITRQLLSVLRDGSGGFEVRELHIVASGTCPRCAGQERAEPEDDTREERGESNTAGKKDS